MITEGYSALGFEEVFLANPTSSLDWFKLAGKAFDAGAASLAHDLLTLSYQARAAEIQADADCDPFFSNYGC